MKKITTLLLTTACMLLGSISYAQTETGNYIVGANIARIAIALDDDGWNSASLTPRVGYFIRDNFALGAEIPLTITGRSLNDTHVRYGTQGLGIFTRYYLPLQDNLSFFGGGGFGFLRATYRNRYDDWNGDEVIFTDTDTDSYANINAGIAYFLTPSVGLEGVLNVGDLLNRGTLLSFGVGLQVYIAKGSVE